MAERLGALHISQHKRHLVSSIAQQLLYPCQLTNPRVAVLGPQEANADNGEHGQQHWQYNLVPSAVLRKHWYNMIDAPAHAKQKSSTVGRPCSEVYYNPQCSMLFHSVVRPFIDASMWLDKGLTLCVYATSSKQDKWKRRRFARL